MCLIEHVLWVEVGETIVLDKLAKDLSLDSGYVLIIKLSERVLVSEPCGVIIAIDCAVKELPDGAVRSEVESLGYEAVECRRTQVDGGLTIEQAIVQLLELESVHTDTLDQAVYQVVIDHLAVLVRQEVLSPAIIHHKHQVVLILDYLMFIVVNNIHPMEHPIVCLHKYLVPVLVEPHPVNLRLIHYQMKLRKVIEVESGWQE